MADKKWKLGPQPKKMWLLRPERNQKGQVEPELDRKWVTDTKLDKKILSGPELSKKWLLPPGPLEPMPLGMNCKPWYKDRDRLPSNYLSTRKNRLLRCPTSLYSWRWVFVKEGLDDFRTGCPDSENMITHGPREGFLPTIAHRVPRPPPRKSQIKLPKVADLCSKLSPAQQARKAFVEDIEASLTRHPLACCPNLEEALPADVLLKVLQVLDPDRKLEDTWAYCLGTRDRKNSPTELSEKHPEEVNLEPPDGVNLEPPDEDSQESTDKVNLESLDEVNLEPSKNRFLSYITNLFPELKGKMSIGNAVPKGPSFYQKPLKSVRDFSRWIKDNYGDLGIDEQFIMEQFRIDPEYPLTRNTLKIKKISQIPKELKYSKELDEIKERKFSLEADNFERKLRKPHDPYKPKRVKIRYGAWYLNPKTWKKLVNDEPLMDPKVIGEEEYQNYGRYLEPDIIDDLYGPIAFKDFIVSKGYRMPGVIEKLFLRKGWTYDSVKTPIDRVMKLLSKAKVENDESEEED